MKYDEQYWKDYTFFIAEVERIGNQAHRIFWRATKN
jgi:hypothetical protein